jgi:hypothetical protein
MAGVFTAGRVRAVLSCTLGALLAGPAAAQPGSVAPPPPNSFAQVQAQDPPPVVPRSSPLPLPTEVLNPPLPPAPSPAVTLTQPAFADPLPPLPGSVEDQYLKELNDRRQFQTGTWRGTTVTVLPNSLLWEPPLAVKKDPRMQALASNLPNSQSNRTFDTAIGTTVGLIRGEFEGADFAAQVDMFGVVFTRFSSADLLLADYRFGVPVTFRWNWWQAKVAYEHTTAHLGDDLIRATGRQTENFAKDEVVLGVGRYLYDNLRVYGQVGYAFSFQVPGLEGTTRERTRFDLGAEWFLRCSTGWTGTPFAAANVEFRGDQQFDSNYTFQAGWLWRNPTQRLGTCRVFAEYYYGRSPYGQAIQNRERITGIGFAVDY